MVADSGKIDAISGVSKQTPPITAPVSQDGGTAPVQQPAVKHIDFTDAKAAPAASATPSIPAGLSYTHVPFHAENTFNTNQNGDAWKLGLCKNDMDGVKAGATSNIKYMTVSAMANKAKPVISVVDGSNTFGAKQNYQVADCNITLQDLKSSQGINQYFSVLAMPSSHGHTFRASIETEPAYTLVVTNRETGKTLSGSELESFYTFAANTLRAEKDAQQLA